MEPVTHVLTGACLARSGLNRRAAYATLGMAIAAEFPDIDTLWRLRGPIAGFEHHRGITHSFVGLPVEAGFLLAILIAVHQIRLRRHQRGREPSSGSRALTAAPVRWPVLFGLLLLALASHLLLDYTNNYGLRPFLPFQSHWYAASLVFIFDPWIFTFLVAGLVLPSLFGLIDHEVGSARKPFRSSFWPRVALLCVCCYWLLRAYEHTRALRLADAQIVQIPSGTDEEDDLSSTESGSFQLPKDQPIHNPVWLQARRVLANPDPLSPFRWYTVADFGPAYRLGTADTQANSLLTGRTLVKPAASAPLTAAERSRLGRIYLDWSSAPWLTASASDANAPTPLSDKRMTVFFEDLRFAQTIPWLDRKGRPPLTGEVILDGTGRILQEGIDGHFGH